MNGHVIWRAPVRWSPEQQLAIVAWLQAHDVDTRTVAKRVVVTGGEQPRIHLAVYQTNEQGCRYADLTTDLAVTVPLVVACRYRPPLLIHAPVVDEQLLTLPPAPIDSAHLDPNVGGTEGGIARHLAGIGYQAYADFTGGLNYQGKPMPTWEKLADPQRDAWIAAAGAIERTIAGWLNAPRRVTGPVFANADELQRFIDEQARLPMVIVPGPSDPGGEAYIPRGTDLFEPTHVGTQPPCPER